MQNPVSPTKANRSQTANQSIWVTVKRPKRAPVETGNQKAIAHEIGDTSTGVATQPMTMP